MSSMTLYSIPIIFLVLAMLLSMSVRSFVNMNALWCLTWGRSASLAPVVSTSKRRL
jgi:hypothetical protein